MCLKCSTFQAVVFLLSQLCYITSELVHPVICTFRFTVSLQGSLKERKRNLVVHSERHEIISNIIEKYDEVRIYVRLHSRTHT